MLHGVGGVLLLPLVRVGNLDSMLPLQGHDPAGHVPPDLLFGLRTETTGFRVGELVIDGLQYGLQLGGAGLFHGTQGG